MLLLSLLCFACVVTCASTEKGGLYVQNVSKGNVGQTPYIMPIESMRVAVEIVDFVANVHISQDYSNKEDDTLTASYRFPLDDQASVTSFTATIGGNTVVGKIEEKAQAKKMYDEAVKSNKTAFMLNSDAPDIFVLNIGNLPPRTTATIQITYITKLKMDEGISFSRFFLPSATIADRYAPTIPVGGSTSGGTNAPQARAVDVNDPLSAVISITMPFAIRGIKSPSHGLHNEQPYGSITLNKDVPYALSMNFIGNNGLVKFRTLSMNIDFVLVIEQPMLDTPRAWVETMEDSSRVAMVAYTNVKYNITTPSVKREVIFLVDTSGSMATANRMDLTKQALLMFIGILNSFTWFNFVRFSTDYASLFPTSEQATDDTISKAIAFVNKFQASGGTEMAAALEFILKSNKPAPQHEVTGRTVIIITDGEVTNTDALVSMAAANLNGAHIFTLGIGGGASHALVDGLARVGDGIAEYIADGQPVTPAVLRQAARAISVELHENLQISWKQEGTGKISDFVNGLIQTPKVIPPVYIDSTSVAFKFLAANESECSADATISITSADGWGVSVACQNVTHVTGDTLHKLAVRGRIRDLEESPKLSDQDKAEIIGLSKNYSISSSLTAFIAIMENGSPVPPAAGDKMSPGGSRPTSHDSGSFQLVPPVLLFGIALLGLLF